MMNQSSVTNPVLIIGASGMLGSALMRVLAENDSGVVGTTRSTALHHRFPEIIRQNLVSGIEIDNLDGLVKLFSDVRPHTVINCVGLVKQLAEANDPLAALPINAVFPHRLARLCLLGGARLVHISTDCVFSGAKGRYTEDDLPDAYDLYGRSKLLGEVDAANAVTLRTSIIGHELVSSQGLLEWFLSQKEIGQVRGFTRAIFSGLPTVELARVIRDFVLPNSDLRGLFHVSVEPISKYDLLKTVAEIYGVSIHIEPDDRLILDRSLDSTRFRKRTGYQPPPWPLLIGAMHNFG